MKKFIGIALGGFIVVRLINGWLITSLANRLLRPLAAKSRRVRLRLLRSEVLLEKVRVLGSADRAGLAELTIERVRLKWRLRHKKVLANVEVFGPQARVLVRSPRPTTQEGRMIARQAAETPAQSLLPIVQTFARFFDVELERLTIDKGNIDAEILASDPPLTLHASHVHLLATHVGTRTAEALPVVAAFAEVQGGAFQAALRADPFTRPPLVDLLLEVKHLDLTALNTLSERLAEARLARGHLSLFADLSTNAAGKIQGHVKPLLEDIVIANDTAMQAAWHELLTFVARLLKNRKRDQIATDIPVLGKLDSPDVDVFSAVIALLQNAFGAALQPGFASGV